MLGYWGSRVSIALAIVMPIAAAVVWGMFVAPKARVRVSEPVRWAIELVVFIGAAVALWAAEQTVLAVVYGVAALANGALVRVSSRPAAA